MYDGRVTQSTGFSEVAYAISGIGPEMAAQEFS